jgi:Ni/Fe-hydrogenase subunit HybB-like protein
MEIGLLLMAMALFMAPEVRSRRRGLLIASLATIAALVVHRSGVGMVGLTVPEYGAYRPAWSEIAITAGIISLGLVVFRLAVACLPIYTLQPQPRLESEPKRRETPQLSAARSAAAAR